MSFQVLVRQLVTAQEVRFNEEIHKFEDEDVEWDVKTLRNI